MRLTPTVLLVLALVGLPPVPAQAAAVPVVKRLAVVAIQNGDTPGERTQLADTQYLRNVFFGPSDSLVTWMPAVTHGRLTYEPAGDGVYLAQPVDVLVNGDKAACHSQAARTNAEDFLTAAGVSWDAVAVVYDIAGCNWAGLGQMPGKVTWYTPRPSLAVIAHEMGHNQGYPHQAKRDCPGGMIAKCKENGYSGNSTMASGGPGRSYSSVELLHSGWVEPGWHVQASKPGTYTLKPLHSSVSVTGTRIVEYKASAKLSYVIETRAAGPQVDKDISNPGVRVYAVTIGTSGARDYRNAYLINPGPLTAFPYASSGTVITDAANKLTITVQSSSSTGARVVIAVLGAKPSPSTQPSPSSSPSPSSAASPAPTASGIAPSQQEQDTVGADPEVDRAATRSTSSTGGTQAMLAAVIAGALVVLMLAGAVLLAQRARRSRTHRRRHL